MPQRIRSIRSRISPRRSSCRIQSPTHSAIISTIPSRPELSWNSPQRTASAISSSPRPPPFTASPPSIRSLRTAPTAPINPYGRSKLMVEWMLEDAARAHGLSYVALRYFNVAGADPKGRLGQSSPNATHLIKVAVQAALGMRRGLDIFGTDYPTPDGTCLRDYIQVSDLIAAHVLALKHLRARRRQSRAQLRLWPRLFGQRGRRCREGMSPVSISKRAASAGAPAIRRRLWPGRIASGPNSAGCRSTTICAKSSPRLMNGSASCATARCRTRARRRPGPDRAQSPRP